MSRCRIFTLIAIFAASHFHEFTKRQRASICLEVSWQFLVMIEERVMGDSTGAMKSYDTILVHRSVDQLVRIADRPDAQFTPDSQAVW